MVTCTFTLVATVRLLLGDAILVDTEAGAGPIGEPSAFTLFANRLLMSEDGVFGADGFTCMMFGRFGEISTTFSPPDV